jgi:hypothetical protein
MAILDKGAAVAAELAEEEKRNRPGGFYRIPDLVIKDGESYLLRFATEITDLTTFGVHRFMPTKPKPGSCDWDKWPDKMWAVCQNYKAFRVRDGQGNTTDEFEDGYGDCYLCKTYGGVMEDVQGKFKKDKGRPDVLTYGLAVLCKVLTDPATGHATGFAEETAEYKPGEDVVVGGETLAKKGEIVKLPKMVLIAMRYSTFWHPVQATAFLPPRIIRDKVFTVGRKENDYTITPVATDAAGVEAWRKYDQALAITGFNLDEYLLDHATPDHYAKFFDPDREPEGGYSRKSSDEEEDGQEAAAPAAPAAGPNIDQAALAAFGNRLSRRGAQQ